MAQIHVVLDEHDKVHLRWPAGAPPFEGVHSATLHIGPELEFTPLEIESTVRALLDVLLPLAKA